MFAILAPGQGSQKPGFLKPWIEADAEVEQRLRRWSEQIGIDLIHLGTEADNAEITDTANTQPLLTAAGLITSEGLPIPDIGALAGHSVGEITAAALAGVLTADEAVQFAAVRGREMARACGNEPTTMAAVIGGREADVLAAIEKADAYPANRNGAGQIVAAGSTAAIETLTANPPEKARVIGIKVAGAFHTPYMKPAQAALEQFAGQLAPQDPKRPLLSNRDGTVVTSGSEMLERLVAQVTAPVRWDACMDTLVGMGVDAVAELAPAGTLTGLAKRGMKGVERFNVNTPADSATVNAHLQGIKGE
nr:ACP S-malonyltransferase [Haloglycomyces albus]